MNEFLEVFFWIGAAVIFYTYLGYGMLLYLLVRLKEIFIRRRPFITLPDDSLPPVTLLIAAYNEEAVIDEKMSNCLSLDYPADKLTILWVTDGSTDQTNTKLSKWERAEIMHQPIRLGKTAAINRAMRSVKTPYVVFTDANTRLNREALRLLIQSFQDPHIGCVAGEKRICMQGKQAAAQSGEGIYWKYESRLKSLDARLYSAVGAAGELFAIRSSLYEEMSNDTLLDDFILSLRIVMKGYTIAYCADAYAIESGSANMSEEEKRKVRIAAGGLQSIARLLPLFNPFRYGIFTFQYISHRVLRWSVTPLLFFTMLPLNILLLFTEHSSTYLYSILFLLQSLFYLAGSVGHYLAMRHIKNKYLFIPYYFLFMNINVVHGIAYLFKRNKRDVGMWEKSRRA